jgi:hypothetical protein
VRGRVLDEDHVRDVLDDRVEVGAHVGELSLHRRERAIRADRSEDHAASFVRDARQSHVDRHLRAVRAANVRGDGSLRVQRLAGVPPPGEQGECVESEELVSRVAKRAARPSIDVDHSEGLHIEGEHNIRLRPNELPDEIPATVEGHPPSIKWLA